MVNFECRLGARQLILGRNGAGKSSVFDVLCLLRDFCVRGSVPDLPAPALRFGGPSRTRWQTVPEQVFELDIAGNGGMYAFRLVMDSWGSPERPRVVSELVKFDGALIFRFEKGEVHLYNDKAEEKVQYPFDWHRSALATITERRDNTKLSWFRRWLSKLVYVQPNPWAMRGIAVEEAEYPDQQLGNFADWYRHLRQETEDYDYIRDLGEVIDGFRSMRLEVAGEGRRELKILMVDQKDEYLLGELSEGQRVLIGLYAILHFALKTGTTTCFDEPDNFIALAEVQPWLMQVFDRTEDDGGAQVIIASHHPEVLNRMAFKEGLLFDRPHGRQIRIHRFDDPGQTGLSAAELMTRGWERE